MVVMANSKLTSKYVFAYQLWHQSQATNYKSQKTIQEKNTIIERLQIILSCK
jgi:hypothetical protein